MKNNTISYEIREQKLLCRVHVVPSMIGKDIRFQLIQYVRVHDSRPVNRKKTVYKKEIVIDDIEQYFEVDLSKIWAYSYEGKKIDIDILAEAKIDDGIFFDTRISEEIQYELGTKPRVLIDSKSLIQPKDVFNFIKNFKAVPYDARIKLVGLMIIAWIIIIVNTLIGVHDQMVWEAQTFLYSHYDSDGDSSSPLGKSLAWSGATWALVWMMIRTQLRRYMKFFFQKWIILREKAQKFKMHEIIGGKSRVDLHDVQLRVVACNIECGQYTRGSGTKKRTVSFKEPIQGVLLHDTKVDFIPKNTDISQYFLWELSFLEMYRVLYPEQKVSLWHGIWFHWEVQLIHKEYVDQELTWDPKLFPREYFLEA